MSLLTLSDKFVIVAKARQLDCYDGLNHYFIEANVSTKEDLNDNIVDVILSPDCRHVATITSTSKQLIIYNLEEKTTTNHYILPRSASKIRFTPNNKQVLVADKSGDVLIYDIKAEKSGTKLLGHLSLLLDILLTDDEKFIITCDRDEKIRVSSYPNTYNIQTYCLGHKEFVNHIELLPHNSKYLTSASGDGTVKIWDVTDGTNCYTIDTNEDTDKELNNNFVKLMDTDGIEVNALPIVHYAISKLNDTCSILALCVYNSEELFIYSLYSSEKQFSHKLEERLKLGSFPTSIGLHSQKLYIYNDTELCVDVYRVLFINKDITIEFTHKIKMFDECNSTDNITINSYFDSIKVLYKRKFDNVHEYQERKKQRLEKISN